MGSSEHIAVPSDRRRRQHRDRRCRRDRRTGQSSAVADNVGADTGSAPQRHRDRAGTGVDKSAGEVSTDDALRWLRNLAALRIVRVDRRLLRERCLELRHNLFAYDASHVALAKCTGATLPANEVRLARASGIECDVELLNPPK